MDAIVLKGWIDCNTRKGSVSISKLVSFINSAQHEKAIIAQKGKAVANSNQINEQENDDGNEEEEQDEEADPDECTMRYRIKNIVDPIDQCEALKPNMIRCTRRKKNGAFCKTHCGSISLGGILAVVDGEMAGASTGNAICKYAIDSVSALEKHVKTKCIHGIYFYTCPQRLLYHHHDVIRSKLPLRVIGEWLEEPESGACYARLYASQH